MERRICGALAILAKGIMAEIALAAILGKPLLCSLIKVPGAGKKHNAAPDMLLESGVVYVTLGRELRLW